MKKATTFLLKGKLVLKYAIIIYEMIKLEYIFKGFFV